MQIISQKSIFLKTGLMVTGSSKIWVGVDDKPRELPDLSQGFKRIYSQESADGLTNTFNLISQIKPPPPYFVLEMAFTFTGTVLDENDSTGIYINLQSEGINNTILTDVIWELFSGTHSYVYRTLLLCNEVSTEGNWAVSDTLYDYYLVYSNHRIFDNSTYRSDKHAKLSLEGQNFSITNCSTTITTYSI